MPTLPFKAESIESLRSRYPKCLERIWKLNELWRDRPGMYRDYVFDFEDGTRLLISKDNFYPEDGEVIHVSASWEYDHKAPVTIVEATKHVTEHWHNIGGKGNLLWIGMSPNRVPHWLVKE